MFTSFPWLYVILLCFKHIPLNFTLFLVPKNFYEGSIKLLGAEGDLIILRDNALDFHFKT